MHPGVLFVAVLLHTHVGVVGGHARWLLADDVKLSPTASGAPGAALVQQVLDWLGQYGLWATLGTVVVGGASWGLATVGGNSYRAAQGRTIALAGVIGSAVIGLAPAAINLVFHAA